MSLTLSSTIKDLIQPSQLYPIAYRLKTNYRDSLTRFSTLDFFVKLYPWVPWFMGLNGFAYRFEFAEIFDDENRIRIHESGDPMKKNRGSKISWDCPFIVLRGCGAWRPQKEPHKILKEADSHRDTAPVPRYCWSTFKKLYEYKKKYQKTSNGRRSRVNIVAVILLQLSQQGDVDWGRNWRTIRPNISETFEKPHYNENTHTKKTIFTMLEVYIQRWAFHNKFFSFPIILILGLFSIRYLCPPRCFFKYFSGPILWCFWIIWINIVLFYINSYSIDN
jgi:hypothetical protein